LAAAPALGEDRVPECKNDDAGRQQYAAESVFGEEFEVVVVGVVHQKSTTHGAFPVARKEAVVTPSPRPEQRLILPHVQTVEVEIVVRLKSQVGLLAI
jgi:hypothetical protein